MATGPEGDGDLSLDDDISEVELDLGDAGAAIEAATEALAMTGAAAAGAAEAARAEGAGGCSAGEVGAGVAVLDADMAAVSVGGAMFADDVQLDADTAEISVDAGSPVRTKRDLPGVGVAGGDCAGKGSGDE